MRIIGTLLLVATILTGACGTDAAPEAVIPTPTTSTTPTHAADALANDGRFATLIELLGMFHDRMRDDSWNGTLFAPTDGAFSALPGGRLMFLRADEGLTERTALIRTHILEFPLTPDRIETRTLRTAHGQIELRMVVEADRIRVEDATIVETILASNGVIHVIDVVLSDIAER